MRLTTTFYLILIGFAASAQTKQICITVDDLPIVPYAVSSPDTQFEITQKLLATFKEYDVPAIGYVNEGKLYPNGTFNESKYKLLVYWLDNGFELGNHTYSHGSYNKMSYTDFTEDLLKGEKHIRPLLKEHGKELKYFRHPFLHSGNTQGAYDSLNQFLADHNYIPTPITIDNEDYLFAQAYARAYVNGDSTLMKKIGASYLDHSEQKLKYYENMSSTLFDRDIAQTMLTHANKLNADYMDKLIGIFKKHGYTFVSQEEVLKDEAYQEQVTKFGNWGISWLEHCALSRDLKGDIWKGNPEVPKYITD
ncbi:polysaccharide deacetylase family protein [Fulvivirga lutimaris]|uniref:polysaccharide deacetylase family protein n=1 Tax=Fulvivirga lutimaris TaxID=1819566 RepID=UPI0012BB7CC1|nr:polysaccharide deacetylase family protein [Fulvivirga lutimaris]MTI41821.1 polysaccharide deacetylase-like protein [Fulvivirga lutimaris]